MVRRLLRAALFAGVFVLLWTIARPAHAAPLDHAPFCDDRGASAIAPPPTTESPTDVLDRFRAAAAANPCASADDDGVIGRVFAPGHRTFEPPASTSVPAVWRGAPTVVPPTGLDLATSPTPGPVAIEVRFRIERPPRD